MKEEHTTTTAAIVFSFKLFPTELSLFVVWLYVVYDWGRLCLWSSSSISCSFLMKYPFVRVCCYQFFFALHLSLFTFVVFDFILFAFIEIIAFVCSIHSFFLLNSFDFCASCVAKKRKEIKSTFSRHLPQVLHAVDYVGQQTKKKEQKVFCCFDDYALAFICLLEENLLIIWLVRKA